MSPALFEDKIPAEFQQYHFMIRGWTLSGNEPRRFDRFMKEIDDDLPLKTDEVVLQDEGVAFVRLISTRNNTSLKKSVKRLCRCITNPKKRKYIDRITPRSLLGISPVNDNALISWIEAIFKMALDNGPRYLNNIEVKKPDHIPGWAIVLSFAMIAGISFTGYQMSQSIDEKNGGLQTDANINQKMIGLFGYSGVSAGGNFLKHVMLENEDAQDLEELRDSYNIVMDQVEDNIEDTFNRIKDIRAAARRNMKDITLCCVKAVNTCYYAALLAAQAMLTDEHILETYLTARMKETESINIAQGLAAVGFLTNAVIACEVASAPVSLAAIGTAFTTGAWPTVLMVANPAGLLVSAVGLTILGVSMFRNSKRKEDIIRHQNLSLLISRSCNVINEASIVLLCIKHLDSHRGADAADRYLERVGSEDLFRHWQAFAERDQERQERMRIERGNNYQSSAQRQVSRYMEELTRAQEAKLRACLARFRETGGLDSSNPEESSGEESGVVSGDD